MAVMAFATSFTWWTFAYRPAPGSDSIPADSAITAGREA
jgi:hypothetical protein